MGPTHDKIGRLAFALKTSWAEYGQLYDSLNRVSPQDTACLRESIEHSRHAHRRSIDALARGDTGAVLESLGERAVLNIQIDRLMTPAVRHLSRVTRFVSIELKCWRTSYSDPSSQTG